MASVRLNLGNLLDIDTGNLDDDELHRLTMDLDLTFDGENYENEFGEPVVKFTGAYRNIVVLIDRFEQDYALNTELVSTVKE